MMNLNKLNVFATSLNKTLNNTGANTCANMLKGLAVVASLAVSLVVSSSVHAAEHPAQTIVVESTTKLIEVLKTEGDRIKNDKAFLDKKVAEHVVPVIDFNTMTKLAVGKSWKKASPEQRVVLVTEFKELLLNTYTSALTEYSGESLEFQPFKPEKRDDRAVVRSVFSQAGGSTVPVLYKLRDKEGWLVYDIEVDKFSLVTSYRNAFSNEIEKGGIDGLIKTMQDKNAKSES